MHQTDLMILLICVLACGTLFFSVNAIALRIFSLTKLQEAFKTKEEKDGKTPLENLVANSERLSLTCLLYRLILNVCILVMLLAIFAGREGGSMQGGDYAAILVTAILIFAVFSLAIPNAWAKYAGEKILSRTYKLLMFFAVLVGPVLYIFKLNDNFVRWLTGATEISKQQEKEEAFLTDLEQHKMEGTVDAEEQRMIENVLRLSGRFAGEIMTPRTDIVAVEVNSDLQLVLKTITAAGHSRFPIYEGNIDNIVGLLYARDLLREMGKNEADFKLRDRLRPAYFVPETKPLRELLRELQNKKIHIAILLDEYGGTAGIITLEGILEELIGEIAGEYAKPEPIKIIDQHTAEVDARTYINDLNQQMEINLPESEDYATLGGFILSHLGYIPKVGKSFDYENLKFTVTAAEPRKIKKITISKITPAQTQV